MRISDWSSDVCSSDLIGGSALVLIPLVGLWTQRKPIAAGYVDRFLAEKGVTARYHIADLGFGRQRLTNLVIGDPAHPDLVADWVELSTEDRKSTRLNSSH